MPYYRFLIPQILAVVLGCYCIPIQSQIVGCTDPQAYNFNESAEVNDGFCTYPFTSYSPARYTATVDCLIGLVGHASQKFYKKGC